MRKILPLLLLCATVQHANAGFMEERDIISLAKNTSDTSLQNKIYSSMNKSKKSAKNWMNSWSKYEDQQLYSSTWGEVGFNMLRWSQPGKSYEWKSAKRIESSGILVYQQDSLVDLERAQAKHESFGRTTGLVHNYDIVDTHDRRSGFIGTSQRRMSIGMAPIGPDNEEVSVCKVGRSSVAPFVEMSQIQKANFADITGLDFSYCLSGGQLSQYWKERHGDFVYKDYNRKPSHNPGSSW